LDHLKRDQPSAFRLGDWLNLRARASGDDDLESLVGPIEAQFQKSLQGRVDFDLSNARSAYESHDFLAAMTQCDRIATLARHLPKPSQRDALKPTSEFVAQLVEAHGVAIDVPKGHFIHGSSSYVSEMLPALAKSLEAKGYLAESSASPWKDSWRNASYR